MRYRLKSEIGMFGSLRMFSTSSLESLVRPEKMFFVLSPAPAKLHTDISQRQVSLVDSFTHGLNQKTAVDSHYLPSFSYTGRA